MGCCESTYLDNQIEKAKNIDQIAQILDDRIANFPKERNDFELYIEDPSNPAYDIYYPLPDRPRYNCPPGTTLDDLKKRIKYLNVLEDAYKEMKSALIKYKHKLELDQVKIYVLRVTQLYLYVYVQDNLVRSKMNEFNDYVKSKVNY